MEILKRINQQDDEFDDCLDESDGDSDEEESLSDRLAMVDLDNPDELWAKLLPEEKQEFLELIKSGDVAKLVPEWEPWWEDKHPMPKVRFADDNSEPEYKSKCPKIRTVPEFSHLTKTEPSPQVYFNLINVLASYSITARYMNGDFSELPREAATILINISKNLCSNAIFNDLESAVESVNQCIIDCPWIILEPDSKRVLQMTNDVTWILEGPNEEEPFFYTKAALSEAIEIMCAAKNFKETRRRGKFSSAFPEPTEASPLASKSTLNKCMKKLEYYLSWTDKHLSAYRIK
ncbi:unnamed protein product [Nesidiocoris tenuis]|uniref:Uncharacterized protein n=1 Tax=Nesidiocoris tenuis TaxID=355587 RepID=A0A6H5H2Q5_9HEMI|nr:unnamed protein product [Nesidiocoris tenuis]